MRDLIPELRQTLRSLLRKPGFLAIAVVTLALGIGTNVAIFSTVDTLLLRPLPFPESGRLVAIWENRARNDRYRDFVSLADFADWRSQSTAFERMAAYRWWDANLTGGGREPERVQGFLVSPGFFEALQARPALGRTFTPAEEQPGQGLAVVISDRLWQRRFACGPQAVGATVQLNDQPFTVVGVMPPDFDFPAGAPDLWAPLPRPESTPQQREAKDALVLARLKPGTPLAKAQSEMDTIARRLQRQYPETNAGKGLEIVSLRRQVSGDRLPSLALLLSTAVGFLLLLACANVANLLLSRAADRRREIAVRASLGASRPRLLRGMLLEGIVIALLAGALGLLLSFWGVRMIQASIPPELEKLFVGAKDLRIDGRILAFALGLSLLTGVLAGLLPALQAFSPRLTDVLKEEGGSSPGSAGRRLRNALVVGEVALALVLLVGSALMVRGFLGLSKVPLGFEPAHLFTTRLDLPAARYGDDARVRGFYQQLLDRLSGLPEVESVAAASHPPAISRGRVQIAIEGQPEPSSAEPRYAESQSITAGYFRTLRIPVTAGRPFAAQDSETGAGVAVVSEGLGRRYWPGQSPVGKRLRLEGSPASPAWLTVVGVAGDVRQYWFDEAPRPTVYTPFAQAPPASMSVVLRTAGDPRGMASRLREEVGRLDPDLPLNRPQTLEDAIATTMSPLRTAAGLMSVFGAIALVLAVGGVYAVMAYSVAQRRREVGIRMVMGARKETVLRLVLGQALRIALLGAAFGVPASLLLSRGISRLLFGVIPFDPLSLAGAALLLLAVAVASAYGPARRAATVDPAAALRQE